MSLTDQAKKGRALYMRQYRARNEERVKAYNRNYYKQNKDRFKEYRDNYWSKKATELEEGQSHEQH